MRRRGLCARQSNSVGGGLYDALVGATTRHHDHTLVTADRRAAPVYAALGVDVAYVERS